MAFYGIVPEGAGGHLVTIEAQVNIAAPTNGDTLDIRLLGLPQTALKQGVSRWQAALKNSGLANPGYEIIVNLAPANLPKQDTTLEAPIVAILGVLGQTAVEPEITTEEKLEIDNLEKMLEEIRARNAKQRERLQSVLSSDWVIIGELRLSGELKSTRSLLGMISKAPKGAKIIVPHEAKDEASLLLFHDNDSQVFYASNIREVVDFMLGNGPITRIKTITGKIKAPPAKSEIKRADYSDIVGQDVAKRALEIAVAGGHSILLFGPQGEGKTLLASAIPGIMPPMTYKDCFEINQIYSAKGLLKLGEIERVRPFRKVHSAATRANLLGGLGSSGYIEPGEVSLAHQGVLFLDELPQFDRDLLEQLRAPLAEKKYVIGRAIGSIEYMCNFALVAAMNPCPCGLFGEYKCSICSRTILKQNGKCEEHPFAAARHRCKCSKATVDSYLRRLSGPFLDRIDLKVRVFTLDPDKRFSVNASESSQTVKERIRKARDRQTKRYKGLPFSVNAEIDNMAQYFHLLNLPAADKREFNNIQGKKDLSMRGAVKALQVGRTVADLDGKDEMSIDHILQAMGFMGTSFNETEIQMEMNMALDQEEMTPALTSHLKDMILSEMGRRRLSKNRCAKEMDLAVTTFNKILHGETNISSATMNKITTWLNKSMGKTYQRSNRKEA